jgi:hypothetical protein
MDLFPCCQLKKAVPALLLIFISLQSPVCQVVLKQPLSNRETGYRITARLDPSEKKVEGEMSAFWVNKSTDIVNTVQMHLYLNAFRNRKSTFYREYSGMSAENNRDSGWININSLTCNNGEDLLSRIKFISPDDGNPDDMTVIEIDLPEPSKPGDSVKLQINFTSKLPPDLTRTGYSGDFFFVAQWFPKFGVYEPAGMRYSVKGGWNCHQFHRNSEFYSNHSVYEVNITVPEDYVVGSGGLLLNESENGNGNKTLLYRAEDIVDFAWTAWPGYAVFNDEWKHVKIHLLLPAERKSQVARQFQAVKNALEYLEEHVGPYPWPHLTFIDPPSIGAGAGGMEYTTLFTSQSFFGVPAFMKLPEMVTVHEFGHAYFMGILASNEFEEPWLDEGINTYWEGRIMDNYYTGMFDFPLPKTPDRSLSRISYVSSESRQAASNAAFSWQYPHMTYGMMSYNKTAVILQTLEGIIGQETMDKAFREYYRRWAFKHPSGKDFINTVNEVVTGNHGDKFGPDLNWFFNQTLYGSEVCDYRVEGFRNERLQSDSVYNSTVELERAGGLMLPVDVLIHFDNGDEIRERWDGISRIKDYDYTGKRKIVWVKVDPDFTNKLDINYLNNSMTDDPDNVPERRMRNKLISFLQFFLSLMFL